MSTQPVLQDATSLAAALAAKEIASRELLELFIERIDRLDASVNAVVTRDLDRARQQALALDDARVRGERKGPLHGLPVTIKDAIATEGIRSTGGAVELASHVPEADAPAVARLKEAGAIVFGKTNLPRWSGDFQTFNDIFGTTHNPWDPARVPGGSSGGAAAAVACGFTSFELGTDIGGSVRFPAHCCGVFGLKPTFGVVPQRGYLDRVGGGITDPDINVFGPIARSAEDLDLLLGVLAGPDPERAVAWRLELPAPRRLELTDLRVGVWFDAPDFPVQQEYRSLLGAAVDRLAAAGAKVEESRPPVDFGRQIVLFQRMVMAAASPSYPEVSEILAGSHAAWLAMEDDRARIRQQWAEWFDSHDILLCPVAVTPAFPHDQEGTIMERVITVDATERPYFDNMAWPGLVGITGHPSAVIPIGRTSQNLPVGIQVVAGFLRDREATHAARLFSEPLGGFEPPPRFE